MDQRARRRGSGRRPPEPEPTPAGPAPSSQSVPSMRWVCDCTNPPTLLATYDDSGRIEVKVRDRRYVARDRLLAICPRCGTRHLLQIRSLPDAPADTQSPSSQPGTTESRDPDTHEPEYDREP